jgi:hypothetical protein
MILPLKVNSSRMILQIKAHEVKENIADKGESNQKMILQIKVNEVKDNIADKSKSN